MWERFEKEKTESLSKLEVRDFLNQNAGPLLKMEPSLITRAVENLFAVYDLNGDGQITRTEMRTILKSTLKTSYK